MRSQRVTIVADELLGHVKTGGLGTGASFLALARARMGHRIDVLYLGPTPPTGADEPWARRYASAGIRIRLLPRDAVDRVEPSFFAQMRDTEQALLADPPDVVITQDLGAPTYTALRLRQLGLAFADTRFVVNCYGTRRWITDMSAKTRVLPGAHAVTVLERASLELADAVVSPSRYLVDWMREQGWQLPEETFLIPYYTQTAATGEAGEAGEAATGEGPVRRIAFFGRLEERKGIAPFLEALDRLETRLLADVELAFVGKATPAWPTGRIDELLAERVRLAVKAVVFATELDQQAAIDDLRRPGTLAVLPSYGETFGNAVRECLEHGIPFLAADTGAVPELVAREDWERTLFPPTASGIEDALRRRLTGERPLAPARTALEDARQDALWEAALAQSASRRPPPAGLQKVDVIVVYRGSAPSLDRCLTALSRQTHARFRALVANASGQAAPPPLPDVSYEVALCPAPERDVAQARSEALRSSEAEWVVFLDEEDVPNETFLETLLHAQDASGADVVSCGIAIEMDGRRVVHLFLGEPGGLGLLSNAYGSSALIRRSLLPPAAPSWRAPRDPDWPLLACLGATGALIVSVPSALLTRSSPPGTLGDDAVGAFLALEQLERALPRQLEGLARVAGGLAADAQTARQAGDGHIPQLAGRVRRRLRSWGIRR